jgi:elongation factor P--(R)-beta-lysine ligase
MCVCVFFVNTLYIVHMKHISHIQKQKKYLDLRWEILKLIREFFWSREFTEVETPALGLYAGQEPYISPMELSIHDNAKEKQQAYLHTSPEYALKKMLAAGYEKIFFLGKCFRDYESFGGLHNPEFTMLEFYKTKIDMFGLMDLVESLLLFLKARQLENTTNASAVRRMSMKELWQETIGVDLDLYLTHEALFDLCIKKGYEPEKGERYEDLFYRIFLNEIEPCLKNMGFVMVYYYPCQMASLAKLSSHDPRYAERVEVYADGVELANGFTELTDGSEQRQRFEEEQDIRKKLGKPVFPIDEEFIAAVDALPDCAGIAVGVDRLVQVLLGCEKIDDVLVLPMSELV